MSPFVLQAAAREATWPSRSSDSPAVRAPRSSQREDADDGCGGRAGLCRAGRRWLGSGSGRANGVLASVLAALLCCTVVCVTYVCIHEIERSLNFNLYNTDYLFVPRASRASTRGCSPARFLHCAIAPQGASETKHDLSSTKISYTQMATQNLWVMTCSIVICVRVVVSACGAVYRLLS